MSIFGIFYLSIICVHLVFAKWQSIIRVKVCNLFSDILIKNYNNFFVCELSLTPMQAYVGIHHPKNLPEADLARRRLIFDEFFYLQVMFLNLNLSQKGFYC